MKICALVILQYQIPYEKTNNVLYFKDLFKSIPKIKKIVLLLFLIKNGDDSLTECGFLKSDIHHLCLEFKKNLPEQNEEYLDYIRNQKESILEEILNK